MHEHTCEENTEKKYEVPKYSTVMQVGSGVNNIFTILASALGVVFQTLRYIFLDEEQQDLYKSLNTVVKSTAYDLVIKAAGAFKWYLGLKATVHKAANSNIISEPPLFFQTEPFPSYNKYDCKV